MTNCKTDKSSPIGVFDSGFGGLSAVRELQAILPHENIVYFGDTARVPYGTRSFDTLVKYAIQDVNFLVSNNVKAVVIACGTVSSVAYNVISEMYDLPVVGIVSPACEKAAELTKNGIIGIWGTNATIKSRSFENEIMSLGKAQKRSFSTCAVPCPMLVPLIENGYISENCEMTRLAVKEYLGSILSSGADTLILGCTHYPLISEIVENIWHEYTDGGKIVNSGKQSAHEVRKKLELSGLINDSSEKGILKVYSSDDMETFSAQAKIFLSHNKTKNSIEEDSYSGDVFFSPEKIQIDKY